jgi:hypothetical protein
MATDCTLCVEVQGANPDELIAEAVRHAQAFFGLPADTFEVELGLVCPATWNPGGQVAKWQADAEVRVRRT